MALRAGHRPGGPIGLQTVALRAPMSVLFGLIPSCILQAFILGTRNHLTGVPGVQNVSSSLFDQAERTAGASDRSRAGGSVALEVTGPFLSQTCRPVISWPFSATTARCMPPRVSPCPSPATAAGVPRAIPLGACLRFPHPRRPPRLLRSPRALRPGSPCPQRAHASCGRWRRRSRRPGPHRC